MGTPSFVCLPDVMIAPGEIKEIEVETSLAFRPERLTIAPLPEPRWWKPWCAVSAIVMNILFCIPIILSGRDGHCGWCPLYERRRDPRLIRDIRVARVPQICMPDGIPASFFSPNEVATRLTMDTAPVMSKILVVVENTGKKELPFKGCFIGRIVE